MPLSIIEISEDFICFKMSSYTSNKNYKRNRSAQEPEGLPRTPSKVKDNQDAEEQRVTSTHKRGTARMKLRLRLRRLRRKRSKRIRKIRKIRQEEGGCSAGERRIK